jgi:hypothetical protein
MGPSFFFDSYWDFTGQQQSESYSFGGLLELRSGAQINVFAGRRFERLKEPFEIFEGVVVPSGGYPNPGFFLFFNTNRSRAVSLGGFAQGGGLFNGSQLSLNPSLSFRLGDYLSSQLSWSRNDVDLETGAFKTNLGRLRVTFAFSTKILLSALIQYNDVTDDVSTNLRFSWLGAANTGLFVVYNEITEFGHLARSKPDRSLVVKYSRLFDVFH